MTDEPLATVQRRFAEFAQTYHDLRLYAAICRHLSQDADTAALLTHARPGQDRPVLWLAALHDLVLRSPGVPAARWYPSVVGPDAVPPGDPWPDVRRTVLDHWEELTAVIATRTTQTNEVNRCVYLAAALALAAADRPDQPVVLVELGASAGLLLDVARHRVELHSPGGDRVLGDPASGVVCRGVDRSPEATRGLTLPRVVARVGLDLHPVRLDDEERVRWLEACLWPDVPGRVERFRAALEVARADPPEVVEADMVDDLLAVTRRARSVADATGVVGERGPHVVAVSSWALTYVERARRSEVVDHLAALARDGAVSWVTAEPPGCVPGIPLPDGTAPDGAGTVLGLHRWRDGRAQEPRLLGTCHQHGEWVDLRG